MTAKRKILLATIIVPIQAWCAVLAWQDLARRADDQVRGTKNLRRAIVSINHGNSLLYWLFGRR
jgi:hypothetical protein